MAYLKIAGSSSKGNSYILECNNEILLIEAGVSFKNKILPAINWEGGRVVGCLVSHRWSHSDHSLDIPNLIFIDEITHFNSIELELLNRLAEHLKANNIFLKIFGEKKIICLRRYPGL